MSLIIRKKSAYTWEHYFDGATVPYITNVFNINNGGNNTFQLVDYRGSNLQAVPIADITLYDDTSGGTPETFSTFAELNTRLGILQYPPMKTSGGGGGGVESVSGVLLNNTDPLNPIVNGLIVDAYSQVKEISFSGATVTNDGSGKVTVTITDSGVTEFIELTDVPASYTGQGTKVVAVKVDESGLEFVAGGGSQDLQSVLNNGTNATFNDGTFDFNANDGSFLGGTNGYLFNRSSQYTDGNANFYSNDAYIDATKVYLEGRKENVDYFASGLFDINEGKVVIQQVLGDGINNHTKNLYFEDSDFPIDDTKEFNFVFPKDEDDGIRKVATREWVIANVSGSAVDSVNGQTGVVVLDSDDINEGTTNLYFTDARALGAIPDATPTVKGIAKLYTSLGSNTDGAVDQNTVNTALALKANLQNVEQIIRSKANGTFGSHTGDTAETVIAVIDIDANEFEAGDWMTLLFSGEKDATVGNVTWRLRAGVNGNTSDVLIATVTASAANSRYCALYRGRPQFLTGNQLRIWGGLGSANTDISSSGAPTLASLNPTSAWKLTVTAQLTVLTETASLTGYRIGKIKSF